VQMNWLVVDLSSLGELAIYVTAFCAAVYTDLYHTSMQLQILSNRSL